MVSDAGQLYTIEGVAAAILMVFTAYIMLNSTTLYTPGETHVTDMQMEQLGNDALAMMDMSEGYDRPSPLELYISGNSTTDKQNFADNLSRYLNATNSGYNDNFKFSADVFTRLGGVVKSYHFTDTGNLTGTEHPMKVTRWVYIPTPTPHTVLLEVVIWRD